MSKAQKSYFTNTRAKRAIVSELLGGERISTREVGDNVTKEDIHDTMRHVPGADAMIWKLVEDMFHNGFNVQVPHYVLHELMRAWAWTYEFGFAVLIVSGKNIEAQPPKIENVGFIYSGFDEKGRPTEIEVYTNPQETNAIPYTVKAAKPEDGIYEGFYPLRTLKGLPGVRGLSMILPVIDVLRIMHEIWCDYAKYAKKQGLAHPVVRIKDLDDEKYDQVSGQMTEANKDKAVIIDVEDDFYYESPQQNAYDPFGILEYGDRFITRTSNLNRLQLAGDPGGIVATSETMTTNWYSFVKTQQEIDIYQIQDILVHFRNLFDPGSEIGDEEIEFNDPTELKLESQMEGVKLVREALDGLVPREEIVAVINEYMGRDGEHQFTVLQETEDSPDESGGDDQESDQTSKDDVTKEDE